MRKVIKKFLAILTAMIIVFSFTFSASAYISIAYQGYYHCTDTSTNYLLFFTSDTTSVFRGSLSTGNTSGTGGTYAASDFDGENSTIETGLSTDNMVLLYESHSKLINNSFVKQSGSLTVIGTVLNTAEIRIMGVGKYYYYKK